jgi:Flp pilus assembly protein TadD
MIESSFAHSLWQRISAMPDQQAESVLASALGAGQLDEEGMGELAIDLFRSERYLLAIMLFAAWTELEPSNPEPWSNLGLCLSRNGQHREARTVLEHAYAIRPGFAPALNNLCTVYQYLGEHDLQFANASEAVRLQPTSALAYNNLGTALMDRGQLADAKLAFETSRSIDPANFETEFNLARVASDEGRHAEALAFLESALASPVARDRHLRNMIEYHLSYEYLATGRLAEGWDLYERGFASSISPTIARTPDRRFSVPRWEGQPLAQGQRLMIWREQGIGDELRFASLLPLLDVGEGHVVVECDPRLVPTFERSFPAMQFRSSHYANDGTGKSTLSDYDFHCPIGSLPKYLMRDRRAFSHLGGFLQASPWQAARFAQRLAGHEGKRKIGICWRSHKLGLARDKKYTSLVDWRDIFKLKETVFVSLQYGDVEAEIREAEKSFGIKILRWRDVDLKDDIEAVFGLMQNLDAIISPSTAVLPMAGALGRPTIFVGHPVWWMLGESDVYPWFQSVAPCLVGKDQSVSSGLTSARKLLLEFADKASLS